MANQTSDIKNYPFLTAEEFAEACHHLDRSYCQATLGPLRRRWKLRVNTALIMAFTPAAEYSTYVQIIRPLDADLDDGDLSAQLGKLAFDVADSSDTVHMDVDQQMIQHEATDEVRFAIKTCLLVVHRSWLTFWDVQSALRMPPAKPTSGYVTYEIHLHPTYRSPCLWFTLHGLPPDEPAFNIDTVFRRLVPDQYKNSLRNSGPIGGISADVGFFSLPFLGQMALCKRVN